MDTTLNTLRDKIEELMVVHRKKDDSYMKLFALCLMFLKNPSGNVANRMQLIAALEQLLSSHKEKDHVAH